MRKIVLTGPESSGKTTLAESLAEYYQTLWVPEYARFYIENLGRPYTELDLLEIAKEQVKQEDHTAAQISNVLFCDTDLITIRIWQKEKFKGSFRWINQEIENRHYDAYLLCAPDIPWEPDPLRENPDDRERLYATYEQELVRLNKKVLKVSGTIEERLQQATSFIDRPM
ncbi:MAG: NadR type nicotinamide-nucleotide adenylyltransferase [Polaribacter sp.]|jgi:NadR type nicotinamide-nucleotide adenylyltransferase